MFKQILAICTLGAVSFGLLTDRWNIAGVAWILMMIASCLAADAIEQWFANRRWRKRVDAELRTPMCPNCHEYLAGPGNPEDWCDQCTHQFGDRKHST